MNTQRFTVVVTLVLLGLAVALLLCLPTPAVGSPPPVPSSALATTRTVCPAGPPDCDFDSIQAAVDASQPGDLVKVAAGTYGGASGRPAPPGYPNLPPGSIITQVLYITLPLTIQGGYTTDDWDVPDPVANPTILDAEGEARVLVIGNFIDAHIEGLRLVQGNAAGLGGHWSEYADAGGGAYVLDATATLSNCQILSGTATFGGGLYLLYSGSTVIRNTVAHNTSTVHGGGLYLRESNATIIGNTLLSNTAVQSGGGLFVHYGSPSVSLNTISGNLAEYDGGGAYFEFGSATLDANLIHANTAQDKGGGLYLWSHTGALTNNVLADNLAPLGGNDIAFEAGTPSLLHNTIAHRSPDPGQGLYVTDSWGTPATVYLTDTILAGHDVAIQVTAGSTATLEATLWGADDWANGSDWGGIGTIITGTVNLWADPAFRAPLLSDYHLLPGSAAIDAGLDAGVLTDLDGDARPWGDGFEIGADEYYQPGLAVHKHACCDVARAGDPITYTLYATNTGLIPLTLVVTDLLPAHVTPGGSLTWTISALPPGEAWVQTVVVTADFDYAGPLTNVLRATALEGVFAAFTDTLQVVQPIQGLTASNDSPTGLGGPTTLTAAVTAGSPVTYTWAFGDGASGSGPLVAHTYPATGTYTALVTAANSVSSMTATTTVLITEPYWYVYLPLIVRGH